MKTIIIPASVSPFQVDGFPAKCVRSPHFKGGSVHVRPAQTLVLSDDEWQHISALHPSLAAKATVIEARAAKSLPQRLAERGKGAKEQPAAKVREAVAEAAEPQERSAGRSRPPR